MYNIDFLTNEILKACFLPLTESYTFPTKMLILFHLNNKTSFLECANDICDALEISKHYHLETIERILNNGSI